MKILLGLSGGVDSTYAALRLKAEGHTVEAAVLVMHEYTSVAEAEESARSLDIPLHVVDCRARFDEVVKRSFAEEYLRGRTPNPCVVCNSEIKFIYLLEYAESEGFDAIATGHYASVVCLTDSLGSYYAVKRGRDVKKDQTYMLWRLPQRVLSRLVMPLSDMTKDEIREGSRESGLAAADRPDSQEICFLPNGGYAEFIEDNFGKSEKGSFIDSDGNILGEHSGIIRYTVGQRKGLGISLGARAFVTDIDPVANTVTLSTEDAYFSRVLISGIVYSGMRRPGEGEELRLSVKLRYSAPPVMSTVRFFSDRAEILTDTPVRAVTPGQSAVLYDGDILVAGGFIDKAYRG
ncbi:MAG: tRNA 2-thiouridine(34) synthase MnmA [Ruminococcaceae bacterium]|nr:tRNA 2-thiouridine(34) synthase MnmA [Oscillospiraceae bacterium]